MAEILREEHRRSWIGEDHLTYLGIIFSSDHGNITTVVAGPDHSKRALAALEQLARDKAMEEYNGKDEND